MRVKGWKFVTLCIAAVLSLAGCAKSVNSGNQDNTVAAGEATEITFWSTKEDGFAELCEEFKAETGITVNATYMGGYDDMVNKVMAGIAGKKLPDVAQLGQRHGLAQMYDSGFLLPIEDYISEELLDDILPGFWKRFTYKGKKVIIPFQNSMPVLYYNKTLFDENSFQVPDSFDRVVSTAKEIKEQSGIYGFTLNSDYTWYILALAYNSGVQPVTEGKATANVPEIEHIFRQMGQMSITDKSMPANQHSTAQEDFCNGNVAMLMSSCASYAKIQKLTDGKFEVGVAQFPSVTTMDIPMGGNGLGMFRSTPEKEKAAALFIEFMLDKNRIAGNTLSSGYIPVTNAAIGTDIYKSYLTDPNRQVVDHQMDYLGGAPVDPTDSLVWNEFGSLLDSVEADADTDIQARLAEIDIKITEYLRQYAGNE